MRFGEKIVVFVLRPIYRTFFERLFWWFLLKVKLFMLADIRAQLESIETRLQSDDSQRRWAAMEDRLRNMEAGNAAQWDAMEQLLLALFRSSHLNSSEARWEAGTLMPTVATSADRVHAADNSR